MQNLNLSMESDNESVKAIETEVVIYATIGNPEGLNEAASKEEHVQLEAKFTKEGGRSRVRKVIKDDDTDYIYTIKFKQKEESDQASASVEHNVEVDADFFEAFKAVSERALKKTRYTFNSESVTLKLQNGEEEQDIEIPNVQYEVDVYTKADGSISDWCKIDIEVDNIINYIAKHHKDLEGWKLKVKVSHLPFNPSECILGSEANTEDNEKKVDDIWATWTLGPDNV